MRMNQKALFLDRDGVINIDKGYTHLVEDLSFVEGIFPLCQAAQQKGYLLIIITNQSGIARGMYTLDQMECFHLEMLNHFSQHDISITHIYFCPHHPSFSGKCLCRKPENLLFEKAISRFHITPGNSWMIGDSERDIIAGKKSGCKTIIIGNQRATHADYKIETLSEAIGFI